MLSLVVPAVPELTQRAPSLHEEQQRSLVSSRRACVLSETCGELMVMRWRRLQAPDLPACAVIIAQLRPFADATA